VSGDWRPTLLAVGLLLGYIFGRQIPFLANFFSVPLIDKPGTIALIVIVMVIWFFALRFAWRSHLFQRYLGIDFQTT
jgi:cation-transporting ATPase E